MLKKRITKLILLVGLICLLCFFLPACEKSIKEDRTTNHHPSIFYNNITKQYKVTYPVISFYVGKTEGGGQAGAGLIWADKYFDNLTDARKDSSIWEAENKKMQEESKQKEAVDNAWKK